MPVITILQVPMAVANVLSGTPTLEFIRQRGIGLFVRGVLSSADNGIGGTRSLHERVSAAIAPDFVTAAIVGVSTRPHLAELLSAIP
jgi:aryl-alcohol dehydrogenase-like predicted oxidoreductase